MYKKNPVNFILRVKTSKGKSLAQRTAKELTCVNLFLGEGGGGTQKSRGDMGSCQRSKENEKGRKIAGSQFITTKSPKRPFQTRDSKETKETGPGEKSLKLLLTGFHFSGHKLESG